MLQGSVLYDVISLLDFVLEYTVRGGNLLRTHHSLAQIESIKSGFSLFPVDGIYLSVEFKKSK